MPDTATTSPAFRTVSGVDGRMLVAASDSLDEDAFTVQHRLRLRDGKTHCLAVIADAEGAQFARPARTDEG